MSLVTIPNDAPVGRAARTAWLRWSTQFRYGAGEDRVRALRDISLGLDATVSARAVVKILGDPWRRALPRRVVGARIGKFETLFWRHPTEPGCTIQVRCRDGWFDSMRFIVDEGALLPPRVLGPDDYWELVDRAARGIRFVLRS